MDNDFGALEITKIEILKNYIGIGWWSPNIGFGEVTIATDDGDSFDCYSECMAINEDKTFIEELMKKFVAKMNIVE